MFYDSGLVNVIAALTRVFLEALCYLMAPLIFFIIWLAGPFSGIASSEPSDWYLGSTFVEWRIFLFGTRFFICSNLASSSFRKLIPLSTLIYYLPDESK